MKTLPVVKCTISTENEEVDVTRWIDECDMLETVLTRDKTSGVLATVTFPVNFVGAAREYIKRLFDKDGLYAKARLNIYLREDYGVNYELVKSTALDFGSYKEYEERVTIECAEEELTQLINSEGKTKYEIPVNDVKDENGNVVEEGVCEKKQWDYQRMELLNGAEYTISYDTDFFDGAPNDAYYVRPNMTLNVSEITPGGPKNDLKEQSWGYTKEHAKHEDYFMEIVENIKELVIDIDLDLFCGLNASSTEPGVPAFEIIKTSKSNVVGSLRSWPLNIQISTKYTMEFYRSIKERFKVYNLKAGDKLTLCLKTKNRVEQPCQFKCTRFEKFSVTYGAKSTKKVEIDVIDPVKLMQKYLDSMSGNKGYFTVEILWPEEKKDYTIKLVAAESIRRLSNAKIYGTPNDLFEWLKVLGIEYECNNRKLIFKPRKEFFKKNVAAMGLREHELADLIIQADNTYAYTSLEIGYDKQEYESINGRSEANGTFCYTTGFIAKKDNKLSLISPYRADSLGIELLCQEADKKSLEANKKSSDTKSDNDVFFVALTENENGYTEYRGIEIQDTETGIRLFNAPFNPYFLVQENGGLIRINAKQVKFRSTDMSRTAEIVQGEDVVVNNLYADQEITAEAIFDPIEYNFAAGYWQKVPDVSRRNGLVYFEWKGQRLKGFIKEIRKNYVAETETTWLLWAVK